MSNVSLMSSFFASPHFLRRVLWLDAGTGMATGALQLLLPGFLAGLLGLPEGLLIGSGWLVLVYVAGTTFLATREVVPTGGVWVLIVANLLWMLACLALLVGELVAPTLMGMGFIAVHAVFVGVLAELQWLGVRRAAAQPAW